MSKYGESAKYQRTLFEWTLPHIGLAKKEGFENTVSSSVRSSTAMANGEFGVRSDVEISPDLRIKAFE